MRKDGRPLSIEKSSGRGLHSFLDHLASGVDPVLVFERVALLKVNPDGTVHLLHSLFSVPVGLYSNSRWIFACCGEPHSESLPPVVDMHVYALKALPRLEHTSHLEGVTPLFGKP